MEQRRELPVSVRGVESDDFLQVEQHGLEPIPTAERHGSPRELGFLWAGAFVNYVSILTASLLTAYYGLGVWDGFAAYAVGTMIGAIGLGLLSNTGPRTGLPQIAFSRAIFGYLGSFGGAFLTLFLAVGWFAVDCVIAAQALVQLGGLAGMPDAGRLVLPAVLVIAAASVVVAVFGHQTIKVFEAWGAIVFVVFVAILFVVLAPQMHWTYGPSVHGAGYLGAWILGAMSAFALVASWYPFASDYSRYLPEASSATSVTWWTTAGIAVPMLLFGLLGLLLVTIDPNVAAGPSQLLAVIAKHAPIWLVVPFFVFVILGEIWANYLDVYTAGLVTLAMDIKLKRWQTAVICGLGASLLSAYAVVVTDFHTAYETFLILTYLWAPAWTAVVLIDFFWLRRSYRPLQVLRRHGPYWFTAGFNLKAITAWVLGTICALGFVNYPNLFTYPTFGWAQHMVWFNQGLINSLHQADISGLISAMVAAVIYLLLTGPLRGAASVPGDQGAP